MNEFGIDGLRIMRQIASTIFLQQLSSAAKRIGLIFG
jgi:hypothetical protein